MHRITFAWLKTIVTGSLILAIPASAQIPNPGFEDWTAGNPDGWFTSNIPGLVTPITQASDANSGQYAVKGEVVEFSGNPFAPLMTTFRFPVSMRHGTVDGWYKFTPEGEDFISVIVGMSSGQETIGAGVLTLENLQGQYAEFSVEILYSDSRTPDSCFISFAIVNATGETTIGSSFTADDFSLGLPTAVHGIAEPLPSRTTLFQNYPNPFNPETVISYSLPARTEITVSVFNLLGEQLATLVNGHRDAGYHEIVFDGSNLPGGVYFYRLQAADYVETKKLILLK